jgi:hypothetical protein
MLRPSVVPLVELRLASTFINTQIELRGFFEIEHRLIGQTISRLKN